MGKQGSHGPRPVTMARSMAAREAASADWEAQHNNHDQPALRFEPERHAEYGLKRSEYVDAYYRAWVAGKETYNMTRGTSDAVFYWLVDVLGEMTPEEYDESYGEAT